MVYGVQSSFLVVENLSVVVIPNNQFSDAQLEAAEYMSNILKHDKRAFTIAFTVESYHALSLIGSPYQLTSTQIFYTAENPELPLMCLRAHNYSHAYLYLDNKAISLANENSQSWLITHLLPMLNIVYRNSEVTIYNASSVSFPQSNTTTALVLPLSQSINAQKSSLYAYDLLSMGQYSYTSIYDKDSTIFSYDTLVLPFDPPSNDTIVEAFEDNFSSEKNWIKISGTWQYTESGLIAGKRGVFEDALLLSPVSAQNFTASIIFKPLDCDQNALNYLSLIYKWQDKLNYDSIGLMFNTNGNLNAYSSSMINGQTTIYPSWEGINTGLKWELNDSFNLTVTEQGAKTLLYVNGSQYISTLSNTHSSGLIGIRSTRFFQMLFTDFNVISSTSTQLRSINDYLNYVENGGNLVILNINGYGYFADQLLNRDDHIVTVSSINGLSDIGMSINMPEFSLEIVL